MTNEKTQFGRKVKALWATGELDKLLAEEMAEKECLECNGTGVCEPEFQVGTTEDSCPYCEGTGIRK